MDALFADYQKRLKPHFPLQLIELPHGKGEGKTLKKAEADNLLRKIPEASCVIALDERGKNVSTTAFAGKLGKWKDEGVRDLVVIIGGADGLDEEVRNRADWVWSLSSLTFPHLLVRVILAEQLYRAATILAGHPYHRD